jgi:Ca-activated chloride channel homolog
MSTTPIFAVDFATPWRLWLLAAVAALAVVYALLQSRRKQYAVRFTNVNLLDSVAPKRPAWRRHIVAGLFLLCVGTQVVAFAGPEKVTRVPRERATVMLALDVSLSMEATDVEPSRIEGAKEAAKAFLAQIPSKINVGLVSFNGRATVRVPPTTDRASVSTAIDQLSLGNGTAIGDAILASLDALNSAPADDQGTKPPAVIVVMSDGKTTQGTPDSVGAKAAADAGVPVSTIAFGTADGAIASPENGELIPVPVDPDALRRIADATDGKFYDAHTTAELKSVYQGIGHAVGYETKPHDISHWFVGAALLLALATAALSLTWFSRLP